MLGSILAAVGLAFVFVWSSLNDHMFNLHDAMPGYLTTNPRVFFLTGIFSLCIIFAAAPRTLRTKDATFEILLPLIGAMGTISIAIAPNQNLFNPGALCIIGLVAIGVGYCWLVVRYGLLLARSTSIARIVYCLAAALIMEPVVRLGIETAFAGTWRVCAAASLPLIATALFFCVRHLANKENDASAQLDYTEARGASDKDGDKRNHDSSNERRNETRRRFILLFTTSLLLATVRTLSPVGTWDAEFDPLPMTSSPSLVVIYAIGTILFAKFALVDSETKSALGQFQTAFAIIVLTLLASIVLLVVQGPQPAFLYTLMCLDDTFAHLLFWSSIARMARSVSIPSYRIVGLGIGVYAAGSIIWLLLLGNSAMMQAPVMVAAIATLYVLSIIMINMAKPQAVVEASEGAGESQTIVAQHQPSALADRIAASIEERCLEISRDYALSPRETEVLTLLAQGRTRFYIQEELVLAENTVKTHVAHIYKKLGVNNRQDMLDLVFGKNEAATPASNSEDIDEE